MQLVYHTGQNVGDAINPMVFRYFLGDGVLEPDAEAKLLGIGSILGLKSGLSGRKVVFSSGWADHEQTYGKKPRLDHSYDIRAVRGPLTAESLGLADSVAVTDGAYLICDVLPRDRWAVSGVVGIIPHHKSLGYYDEWGRVCRDAGLQLLDVRQPPREFMQMLWRCEYVLCEAMHGAIFADAYRIPWLPIRLYPHINEFKWRDWALSLGMEIAPHFAKIRLHNQKFLTEVLQRKGLPAIVASPFAGLVLRYRVFRMVNWLRQTRFKATQLSDEDVLGAAVAELKRRLYEIRRDYCLE